MLVESAQVLEAQERLPLVRLRACRAAYPVRFGYCTRTTRAVQLLRFGYCTNYSSLQYRTVPVHPTGTTCTGASVILPVATHPSHDRRRRPQSDGAARDRSYHDATDVRSILAAHAEDVRVRVRWRTSDR